MRCICILFVLTTSASCSSQSAEQAGDASPTTSVVDQQLRRIPPATKLSFDPSAMLFKVLDVNADGSLTRDECTNAWHIAGPRLAGNFELIDTDADGMITQTELAAIIARARAGAKGSK